MHTFCSQLSLMNLVYSLEGNLKLKNKVQRYQWLLPPLCEAPTQTAAAGSLCLAWCWGYISSRTSRPPKKWNQEHYLMNGNRYRRLMQLFFHTGWSPLASSVYLRWCMRKAMVAALQRLLPSLETIRTRDPVLMCEPENTVLSVQEMISSVYANIYFNNIFIY